MIGFLRGTLLHKDPPQLVVEVSGVGYEVEAPMSTWARLPEVGHEVQLRTHLVIREDQHLLFGFASEAERAAFETCAKRKGRAMLVGLLVGGLVGGGLGYAISPDHPAFLLYGMTIGELAGIFLGDYWSSDCRTPMAMRYSGMTIDLPPEVRQ